MRTAKRLRVAVSIVAFVLGRSIAEYRAARAEAT